ncbi:MAG: NADH-quinone oxidoreductase subunit N, partial [Desulfocapsa sp.]|nr:NADH-quinone oxidoreductase subunit N [Desulfocapsa sp.]
MQFLPELTLLGAGLIVFIVSLGKANGDNTRNIAIGLGAAIFAATLLSYTQTGKLFFNTYQVDLFSQVFKMLIAGAMLIVLLFGNKLKGIPQKVHPEYYLFMFMSALGLMMLVSSVELLAIFVSLELSSFAVYIMVPMRDDEGKFRFQMEAGIKYLLFGVTATGFMLFGMSYMYGLTGSTELSVVITKLSTMWDNPAAVIAMMMVLAGFFYKLAIFPFHFWVPDVYEGASNETTAFIASVPKLAAVAMLIRLVSLISGDGQVILNVLMVCAVASMFYGNLSALVQKDVKRMLGFSGIAHAGFVLLGILTFQITGFANAMYYIIGYVLMNLACFLVICSVSKNGENVMIDDLAGLHKRSPILAFTLAVGLFALAGIPPFVGFMG